MVVEPAILYTRHDVAIIFKCGYTNACTIYKRIKAYIPKEELKPEHNRTLPGSLILKYIEVTPAPNNQQK